MFHVHGAGTIWQTCRQRLTGGSSESKSVLESLRAQAQGLRTKASEGVHGQDSMLHAAHLEMLGALGRDSNESSSINVGDEKLVPSPGEDGKATPPESPPAKRSAARSASWFGGDEPETESGQITTAAAEGDVALDYARQGQQQQQQTAMMTELLALIVSMNNRMKKQDAELAQVRRVVEQGARQGWSTPAGSRR